MINPLKAYIECMNYIRKAKTLQDFDSFDEKMKEQLDILKREETRQGYEWVRKAFSHYKRLTLDS